MSFRTRRAPTLPAVATLLWLAIPSVAGAQDVMELDLAFKSGRLTTSYGQETVPDLQRVGKPRERTELARRHPRWHRHQGS